MHGQDREASGSKIAGRRVDSAHDRTVGLPGFHRDVDGGEMFAVSTPSRSTWSGSTIVEPTKDRIEIR